MSNVLLPIIKPGKRPFPFKYFRSDYYLAREINALAKNKISDIFDALNQIEGHLNPKEIVTLFYFAHQLNSEKPIVEIGSFKGKSAVCMTKALQMTNRTNKIFAIDPHINTREAEVVPDYDQDSSYDEFLQNLQQHQAVDHVTPIKKTAEQASESWDGPISLLFIDGSHRYEDVLLDLNLWEKWLELNGVLIMHDTGKDRLPGVNQAVQEYVINSSRFKRLIELSNMTVFRKQKHAE